MSVLSEKLSSRNILVGELFRRIFPTGKSETAPERSTDEGSVLDSFRLCFHILKCGCHMFVCFCKKLICCILLYRNLKWRTDFFSMYGVLSCRNTCPFLQKKAELITHHSSRMNFQFCTSVRRYASSTDDNTPLPAICYEKQDASWTIHVTQHWMHQTRMTKKKKAWFRQRTVTFLSGRKIDWLKNSTETWHEALSWDFFFLMSRLALHKGVLLPLIYAFSQLSKIMCCCTFICS